MYLMKQQDLSETDKTTNQSLEPKKWSIGLPGLRGDGDPSPEWWSDDADSLDWVLVLRFTSPLKHTHHYKMSRKDGQHVYLTNKLQTHVELSTINQVRHVHSEILSQKQEKRESNCVVGPL